MVHPTKESNNGIQGIDLVSERRRGEEREGEGRGGKEEGRGGGEERMEGEGKMWGRLTTTIGIIQCYLPP